MTKTKRIKVLTSCAGQFGSLSEGDILDLDRGLAESLERAGLVIAVDAEGNPLPEDEKKEFSPATPSETESESSSLPPAPETELPTTSAKPSKRKTTKAT